MTRARILHKLNAPSYAEFHARATAAHGPVIRGAHLDVDPESIEAIRDPFGMARRFAHALALETRQPFAWGWFADPVHGLRPGVCAADIAAQHLYVNGRTDRAPSIDETGSPKAG